MNPNRNATLRRGCLGLVLAAVILGTGLLLGHDVGVEGQVRAGICRELLAGHTPGRQGVVSSVWWGPFPTLATLPAAILSVRAGELLGGLLIGALCGAWTLLLLERALRAWGAGRWRWVMVAGVALNPSFLEPCWNGSSTPLVSALLVLSLYSLTAWVQERRLKDLIGFGLGIAFLLGSSYEMSGWVLGSVLALGAEEMRRTVSRQEKGAVMIVALLPVAYTVALWVLMCWLIMGDAFYAIRSLNGPGPGPGRALILPDFLWWSYACLAVLAALTLASAMRRHDRPGVCLSVLALVLPGAAGLLAWRDLLWDAAPLLTALLPATVLVVGHWLAVQARSSGVREPEPADKDAALPRLSVLGTWLLSCFPLVIAAVSLLLGPTGPASGQGSRPGVRAAVDSPVRSSWLPQLERHVLQRSRFAKVFVCGFEGFALLKDDPSEVFVRALDFNFDKAKHDYYGHVLYLLVHRPEQRNAMDSIHWKYRNIYIQGGQDTLYDSDWGDWRLFELIQVASR